MKRTFIALPLLLLAACGAPSPLAATYDACAEDREGLEYTDGALLLDSNASGEDDTTYIACVIDELGVSAGLRSRMESTSSQDGRQTETENDLTYSWTFHPTNGMEMTIEE